MIILYNIQRNLAIPHVALRDLDIMRGGAVEIVRSRGRRCDVCSSFNRLLFDLDTSVENEMMKLRATRNVNIDRQTENRLTDK